ncbi:MAG TPA: oligoendopeptidase F, partial [Rhabdochlamydiaceae bacterium]
MDRAGVPEIDQWNVKPIYPTLEDWKKEFTKVLGNPEAPHWPVLAQFKGRLKEGPKIVLQLIETILDLDQKLSRLYTYAHLRHDEDVGHDVHKEAYLRIV